MFLSGAGHPHNKRQTMAITITHIGALTEASDGRIVSCAQTPHVTIDGRAAIRGYYTNSVGGMDRTQPVAAEDWAAATLVIYAAIEAREARHAEWRRRSEEREAAYDALLDRMAQVRGGPLDPNAL